MRIGVDAYGVATGFDGFSQYVRRLIGHLQAIGHDILIYAPSTTAPEMPAVKVKQVYFDRAAYPNRIDRDKAWYGEALLEALRQDPPDVFLGTSFFLPLEWDGPMAVTVHDLIFERHPEYFSPDNLAIYRELGRHSAERADAVVTVSQATAHDVAEFWRIDPDRITVTTLGPALDFVPADRSESRAVVEERLGITSQYILSVAANHRRKNLVGAVAAYLRLPESVRRGMRLVLVNADRPRTWDMLERFGMPDEIMVTGWLPDDLVPHVYNAAAMLLCPSFYEGFGLPVLDAMACGTPVVGSNRPAIPEITGGAARLVDPTDTDGIARAIVEVLDDPHVRTELTAAGKARARQFGWPRLAERTADVLQTIAG